MAFTENRILYRYQVQGNIGLFFERNFSSQVDAIYGAANRLEYMASNCNLVNLPEVDCELSITESTLDDIHLYPNPVNDIMYLSTPNFGEDLYYSLYSLEGKLLESGALESELDVQQLTGGVYFLKLHNSNRTISTTKKIIKN